MWRVLSEMLGTQMGLSDCSASSPCKAMPLGSPGDAPHLHVDPPLVACAPSGTFHRFNANISLTFNSKHQEHFDVTRAPSRSRAAAEPPG